MQNSFEMEARGRSEACRIRLGQAITRGLSLPPSSSPLWYLHSDSEHTQRVEAEPPTDGNEQWQLVLPDSDL